LPSLEERQQQQAAATQRSLDQVEGGDQSMWLPGRLVGAAAAAADDAPPSTATPTPAPAAPPQGPANAGGPLPAQPPAPQPAPGAGRSNPTLEFPPPPPGWKPGDPDPSAAQARNVDSGYKPGGPAEPDNLPPSADPDRYSPADIGEEPPMNDRRGKPTAEWQAWKARHDQALTKATAERQAALDARNKPPAKK
jgi:hypothetical protein